MEDLTCAIPEGKEDYILYACNSCGRLFDTEAETKSIKTGAVCECGSTRYRPTKNIDAVQNEAGDYVVNGRYNENIVIPKAVFESVYKPAEVVD